MRSYYAQFPRALLTLCLTLLSLLFAQLGVAQKSDTGLPPFGSFHGSDFDLVSLRNGNLHIEIPILTFPQRGAPNHTFKYVYDMPTWEIDKSNPTPTTTQWTVAPVPEDKVYWNVLTDPNGPWYTQHDTIEKSCSYSNAIGGISVFQYFVNTNYVMTDRHGTKHPFEVRHVAPTPPPECIGITGSQDTGFALDGSGYTIDISASTVLPKYQMADDIGQFNGNSIPNFPGVDVSTTVQNDQHGAKLYEIWTVNDSNGSPQQFRFDFGPVSSLTSLCPILFPSPPTGTSCVESGSTLNLPLKLTLPTGKFYQFTWSTDGNADLLRVDLPTGGYITYTYSTQTWLPPFQHPITQRKARRRVTSRTVSDGTSLNTWTYSGGIVRDPLGNEQVHVFSGVGVDDAEAMYETQVRFYQGSAASGTLLRTINKDYAAETSTQQGDAVNHGTINVRLIRETTILEDGTQSKTETDYEMFTQPYADPSYTIPVTRLNPVERREYAYGAGAPGPLLRRTDYTYLHTGKQNYLSRNIVHRVLSTTVYDGNGSQAAQTVNEYDNYSHPGQPMMPSNAYKHDPAYDTSFVYRGNVTAVSHWRNTDSAMLTTTYQYDDAGDLLSSIDPQGHRTSFDYTDSWANATCVPSGQAKVFVTTITNALNQSTTKKYNSCTGTLASVADPNLNTTSYSYDLMNRLASVDRPDGGHTVHSYDDTQLVVTSSTLTTSTGSVYSRQHYDQLGRVVESELCEDGTSACTTSIKTDTTYDAAGRVSTVSNPYRTPTDPGPTNGITTTQYDALGRVIGIIPSDGTVSANNLTTSYTENCTTATDQAGKTRKTCSDSLGRLIGVDEPTPWPAASGTGSASVSGTEQSIPAQDATSGSGSVTISGLERTTTSANCTQRICTIYDVGGVQITINGLAKIVNYGKGSTTSSIALALSDAFNGDLSSPVTASASGATVTLTSKVAGAASNYSLAANSWTNDPADFTGPSFTATASGSTLTGGTNGTSTTYDSGTAWVTVNGFQALVNYSQGSTSSTVAAAIGSVLNTNSPSPVTASVSGSTITLVAKATGAATNYSLSSGSSTSLPGSFASPSFSVSGSALTGGVDANPGSLATPSVTTYTYDTLDNLTGVLQNGSRQRTFTYNSLSQLTSATNPESGTVNYNYDADGNLLTKTDARGITITYAYDALHRLTGKTYSDSTPGVKYGYDGVAPVGCAPPALTITNGIGRRTAMCDAAGSEAWSYNEVGQTLIDRRITSGIAKNVTYSYNPDSSIATLTYPSGRVIAYAYDAAARPVSAVDAANTINYATNAHYSPAGALASLTNGASLSSTYVFNSRLQPCWMYTTTGTALSWSTTNCNSTAAVADVLDLKYDFGLGNSDNGNVMGIANNRDNTRSQNFSYDALNRIATAQTQTVGVTIPNTNCWGLTFGYDPWGNMLTASTTGPAGCSEPLPLNASVDTFNRLVSNTVAGQTSNYCYDAAGNLIFITSSGASCPAAGPFQYTYNAENQLTATAGVTYTYDGDGKRVQKSNGRLYWYGAGSDPLAESDLSGNISDEYIFFGGSRIARRHIVSGQPDAVSYYFADHLGTSRVVTSATGTILDDADFYPFGGERPYLSSSGNNYKFTGKERDTESGLDNFGARYMSSAVGRFMSADNPKFSEKFDPQTWNLYSYVSNNPLLRIDPTGHNWFNIGGEWKWYGGSDVNADGKACKRGTEGCTHSDTTHLLVIQKTGHLNEQGAEEVKVTLWGNSDPNKSKPLAEGYGFTGGPGISAVPNGNYEINLNRRGGPETNRLIAVEAGLVLAPFHDGIQSVSSSITYRGENEYDATDQWGDLRANLSLGPGRGTPYYLHGKKLYFNTTRPLRITAGCVCEPNQAVLRTIFSLDPSDVGEGSKNGRITVSVTKAN